MAIRSIPQVAQEIAFLAHGKVLHCLTALLLDAPHETRNQVFRTLAQEYATFDEPVARLLRETLPGCEPPPAKLCGSGTQAGSHPAAESAWKNLLRLIAAAEGQGKSSLVISLPLAKEAAGALERRLREELSAP